MNKDIVFLQLVIQDQAWQLFGFFTDNPQNYLLASPRQGPEKFDPKRYYLRSCEHSFFVISPLLCYTTHVMLSGKQSGITCYAYHVVPCPLWVCKDKPNPNSAVGMLYVLTKPNYGPSMYFYKQIVPRCLFYSITQLYILLRNLHKGH